MSLLRLAEDLAEIVSLFPSSDEIRKDRSLNLFSSFNLEDRLGLPRNDSNVSFRTICIGRNLETGFNLSSISLG